MMLFYIDLWQTLAEGAADFVIDGAGGFSDIVGRDRIYTVGSHDDDLVAYLYVRDSGYVDHTLVHTNVSGDRAHDAVDDHLGL